MDIELTQIGTVNSDVEEPGDPDDMRDHESTIVIDEAFDDGLYRIGENDYLVVLF